MRTRLGVGLVGVLAVLLVPSAGASLAGYNGLIAFFSGPQTDAPAIWTMAPDGTQQMNITPGVDAIDPAWSPDATKIAYVRDEGTSREIWLMNADGSGQTQLTSGYFDEAPAWSPDGSEIVFASTRPYDASGSTRHVWAMNSDGSNLRQLTDDSTTSNHVGQNPDWSPDGTRIVFDDGHDIYLINPDGSNVTPLTTDPGVDLDPNYSPDGQKIAFVSDRMGGNANIWVMNGDGTGQTAVTTDTAPTTSFQPVWSPDGTKIAFATDRDGYIENFQIWVMNADGTNQTALITDGTTREGRPSWQRTSTPPTPTSTMLSCTPSTVTAGSATTCTATVADTTTGPSPAGTVQFASNGAGSFSNGGACTLSAGSCQLSYTPSSVGSGTHRITAAYRGNWNHPASSAAQDITVVSASVTVSVARTGSGSGTVISSPTGLSCGSTCSHAFPRGTTVTLTATPSAGSAFTGWSGGCTGASTCSIAANADTAVTASFRLVPKPCQVPKLKGKTLKQAKRSIKAHHCTAGRIKHAFSRTIKKGHVVAQRPKPGKRLKHGGKVNLVISTGRR